jgi:hypothetical protein
MGPRQCARCGSTMTRKRSEKKGGGPDWYKLRTGKGEHIKSDDQLQCARCYNKQRGQKPPKAPGLLRGMAKGSEGINEVP